MNAQIQDQFDKLDAALNTLISSITSYNPSTAAAEALVEADDKLSQSLDELVTHQRNYQTIEKLRATTEALDSHIRSKLSQLADTRNELKKSTPVTLPPQISRLKPVEAEELLMFAQHIARYTVPPTYREPLPPPIKARDPSEMPAAMEIAEPLNRGDPKNTEVHETPNDADHQMLQPSPPDVEGKAIANLAPEIRAWLEPTSTYSLFTPWPGEDVVRRGALSRIEGFWDRGIDPGTVDVASEAEINGQEQE